jgi:hypothetical protein
MHDQYKIESGFVYRKPPSRAGKNANFPFRSMNVGDSFFVPSDHENFSDNTQLNAAMNRARAKLGINLVWSREEGGFRIFRIDGTYKPKVYNKNHS